jgi:hypothetical protein
MVTIHHAKKSNNRMQQADDGSWFITLELETGREYSYGFRTDDGTWLEDMLPPSQVFRPNNTLDQVKSQEAEISKVTFSVPEPY